MSPWLKLATGVALTGLAANQYYGPGRQRLLADLGATTIPVFKAHGVTDASIDWRDETGLTWRTARISGTASPAEQAAIIAEITALPGVHGAVWVAR